MKQLSRKAALVLFHVIGIIHSDASCPEVAEGGCSVCGDGKCINQDKSDAVFQYPGQPALSCSALETAGRSGLIPLDQCSVLPKVPELSICDCQPSIPVSDARCSEVPEGGCSVCGDGKCINQDKSDVVFQYPGQPALSCSALETAGRSGLIPLDQCSVLPKVPELSICDCQPSIPVPTPGPTPTVISDKELISTPRFGACVSKTNSAAGICALGPLECEDTQTYVKASDVEGSYCTTGVQMKIGRCTSNLDKNRCSTAAGNCGAASKFASGDDSCNIVQDLTSSNLLQASTLYPLCNNKQCVLSKSDCDERGGSFGKPGDLPWLEPCYCHHVPTGLCYLSSALITKDSSFCAVSASDCPENYSFRSAYKLEDMAAPPRVCRLCREGDASASTHENVVESGACYSSDNDFVCVLESKDCKNPATFKSTAQMKALGHVPCHADDFTGGYCTSSLDKVGCTNIQEACEYPKKFELRSSCLLHSSLYEEEDQLTYFGRCRERTDKGGNFRQYRCAWQESECDTSIEGWNAARKPESWFDGCNCEHVLTGACQSKNAQGEITFHCAVSALGCASDETYFKSYELEEKANGLVCRLCHPRRPVDQQPTQFPTREAHGEIVAGRGSPAPTSKDSPTGPTTRSPTQPPTRTPTRPPTQPPTRTPTQEITYQPYVDLSADGSNQERTTQSMPSAGVIAGIAIGAVSGGIVLIMIVVFVTNKKRAQRQADRNDTVAKMSQVAVNDDNGMFNDDLPSVA